MKNRKKPKPKKQRKPVRKQKQEEARDGYEERTSETHCE